MGAKKYRWLLNSEMDVRVNTEKGDAKGGSYIRTPA
jgi:hypothetical protein